MRLHIFYEFKGRIILYAGLIVNIIRNISRVINLDIEMRVAINKAENLMQQLSKLSQQAEPMVQDALKKKENGTELQKKVEKLKVDLGDVKKEIRKGLLTALKSIREEAKALEKISLEDDTLFYKKSVYLANLIHILEKSKKIGINQKIGILQSLVNEAKELGHKVDHLELEAKNLRKGCPSVGVTTIILSEVSLKRDQRLMRLIKKEAIEIRNLQSKIKKLSKEDFQNVISCSHQQLNDIYILGNYKDILLRRLNGVFYDVSRRFRNLNIKGLQGEFNKTKYCFIKAFDHIEKLGRRLNLEIRKKEKKFEELEEDMKKKLEAKAIKQNRENLKLYQDVSKTANVLRLVRPEKQKIQSQKTKDQKLAA